MLTFGESDPLCGSIITLGWPLQCTQYQMVWVTSPPPLIEHKTIFSWPVIAVESSCRQSVYSAVKFLDNESSRRAPTRSRPPLQSANAKIIDALHQSQVRL